MFHAEDDDVAAEAVCLQNACSAARSGGLDDPRANVGLSRRRSRVRVPSLPLLEPNRAARRGLRLGLAVATQL
jgi:hypothetical protein